MKNIIITMVMVFVFVFQCKGDNAVLIPGMINPEAVVADTGGKTLYISQRATVFIYSPAEKKIVGSFGKSGEGPGEFMLRPGQPLIVVPLADSLMINSFSRVSFFSKSGKFLRESRTSNRGPNYEPFGDGYLSTILTNEGGKSMWSITISDKNFKKVKSIFQEDYIFADFNRINPVASRNASFAIWKDRAFVDGTDGIIHCYDCNGTELFTIADIYGKRPVTDADKEAVHAFFREDPRTKKFYEIFKKKFEFPNFFNSIQELRVTDSFVYVIPFKREQGKCHLHIFDFNGKLVKKQAINLQEKNHIELYPFTIKNNIVYQLVENDEKEEWYLYEYRL